MIYFTSDTHFGHANIIIYSNRPFLQTGDLDKDNHWVFPHIKHERARQMDDVLVTNWNNKISSNDTVYHLGDFSFGKSDAVIRMLRRLNGKIKFVKGNHDQGMDGYKTIKHLYSDLDGKIEFLGDYSEISIEGQGIILCHYAMATWNKKHHGNWMLCGHSHYDLPATRKEATCLGKILDIGVDGNNLLPYSFEEIKKIMDSKPINTSIKELNDHHTGKE